MPPITYARLLPPPDRFPPGTVVGAYRGNAWSGTDRSVPPTGAADLTATVLGDGSLTFNGLTDQATYFAYAAGSGIVRFTTRHSAREDLAATLGATFFPNPVANNGDSGAMLTAWAATLPYGSKIAPQPNTVYTCVTPFLLAPGIVIDGGTGLPGVGSTPPAAGAAPGSGVIRMAAGANLDYLVASKAYATGAGGAMDAPIHVKGLAIDGNRSNQTAGKGVGIVVSNFRSVVQFNDVYNCRGHGMVFRDRGADDVNLTGSGIESKIQFNWIDNNGGHGVWIRSSQNLITDGFCKDNIVSNTGLDGVHVDSPAGWQIGDNHIWATSLFGIYCTGSYATDIGGNYIEGYGGAPGVPAADPTYSAATTYGMYAIVLLAGALYYSLVDGNLNNPPATSPTQWQTLSLGASVSGIALAACGFQRPTNVHHNKISLGHVAQGLTPGLSYRGVIYQAPTAAGVATVIQSDNALQNELRPAGTNTIAERFSAGVGTIEVVGKNKILGNWTTARSIDAAVVTSGAAPAVAAGAQSAAAVVGADGAGDVGGHISTTAGGAPVAGVIATVTFARDRGQTPKGITVTERSAVAKACGLFVSAKSATSFSVSTTTAPAAGATVAFDFTMGD